MVVGVLLALGVFAESSATAKSAYDSPYGFERTWNASLWRPGDRYRIFTGWPLPPRNGSSSRSVRNGNA